MEHHGNITPFVLAGFVCLGFLVYLTELWFRQRRAERTGQPLVQPPKSRWFSLRTIVEGVLFGVAYGILLRIALDRSNNGADGSPLLIMSLAFLFFGPMVMGLLAVSRAAAYGPVPWSVSLVAPWFTVLLTMGAAMLLNLEGAICVVFALPIAMIGASIGGLIGAALSRSKSRAPSARTSLCLGILPFLLAPLEARLDAPTQLRTVQTTLLIHAPAAIVWQNVASVPAIVPAELHPGWAQRIGFPRPVAATLSYPGIGGVRRASFEHGLLFFETVTAWQPNQRIAFTIAADTAHIPPTTLDQHVTIGGRYFDVLDGEYALQPLPSGDTLLHLTSHQRLTTDFNGYAGLWSDAVMRNLQTSIMQVIQHRCESQATSR